jgi:hypothetical protein
MLAEWFLYLTARCPKHLRALGYPQEIIATQARYRRCKAAWRPHLESSRSLILECAARARGRQCAVILGSGVLLDIPLAELSRQFERVELVDILHLPWVKRHGLRYPNVHFHALDVTGVCEALYAHSEQAGEGQGTTSRLPQVLPDLLTRSLGIGGIDFLASVNLLSQLPLVPCAFLEKRCDEYSARDYEIFSRALIANHLLWLKNNAERVCLITDLERAIHNNLGEEVDREDALYGVSLPEPDRVWNWNIAPRPEVHPQRDLQHRVGGYLNLRDVELGGMKLTNRR